MGNKKRKAFEELEVTDDYMFKLVMRKYPRLCKTLVETVLNVDIKRLEYLETEKAIAPLYDSHGVRFDVYIKDDKQTVYTVEMQVKDYGIDELAKRMRYYQSSMDMDSLMIGEKYKNLSKTYIIFFCPFLLLDGKKHLYTFHSWCDEDKMIKLPDGTTKILLSSKGVDNDVPKRLMDFLNYMNGIRPKGGFVKEIDDAILSERQNKGERERYMKLQMKLDEEREEGRNEGLQEGRILEVKALIKEGLTTLEAIEASGRYTAEELAEISKDV
ncbi:Rpn family recombination-promoting nuclease/putative transposase [Anaerovibrio lipolyticus]|uniref:Rpn family recombination-promoting nuclease/putative transposase n=1 Tax=Anaerovibrio lipolyticus TaxID=82374 RepID=UPI0026EDAB3F|nr:Rpn family recombination-promoting nuclease/putative transposase [Anaerovibrio lipolyticus]MBE6105454.1 Rpn family recombination-promoting nuclease/putative transposase [Anaerovibrio lipolyticus]